VSPQDARLDGRSAAHSAALVILAVIAAGAALYFARELFVPVVLALLFTAVFRPLVRVLGRVRVPEPASATIVVLGVLALIGAGGFLLSLPLQDWAQDAPKTLAAARTKLDKLRRPVQQATQAVAKLQQEVVGEGGRAQASPAAPPSSPQAPAFFSKALGTTASFLGGFLETVVLLFLLLATGDLFTRKLAAVIGKPAKGSAEGTVEKAEAVVRRYLVVTALINLVQGAVVGLVMQLLGMPNPVLWGVLTFFLEFLPYLGGAFMIAFLTITAFATFQGVGHVLLVPASYLAITTIQNNAVSPFAYGSSLRLNPVMVLLVTLVGWFLWGVAGAFVAVPVVAATKIFAEHASRGSRLAAVLGD
jgi:predicted PurR-regulated permease PerM